MVIKEILKGKFPIHLKKTVMDTCMLLCFTYNCQTWTYKTKTDLSDSDGKKYNESNKNSKEKKKTHNSKNQLNRQLNMQVHKIGDG